jgi:arginine utilization regulatory protein
MKFRENMNMDYIDSLAIVDRNFKVIHSYRYNPRFDDDLLENIYSEYIDKNFFEVYPDISPEQSTMYDAIKNNRVVYRDKQRFYDFQGRVFNTRNLTIPIVRKGEVVGAIEISKDITSIDDLEKGTEKNIEDKIHQEINLEIEQLTFEEILTVNPQMQENLRKAKIFSRSDSPTLVYGETGTGKELLVQAMVNHSERERKRFVVLNCAAIPENLFESILFGSEKGAYTGAEKRTGLFEQANHGILFLDELNSMPMQIQAKLLRVLQDSRIRALGSSVEKRVNVKVIAAMNCEPLKAIESETLREDLFYRLSSNLVTLVPLRERKEDIQIYVDYFIRGFNKTYGKKINGVSRAMMDLFMEYEWRGNVRELKHILESMISITEETLLTIKHMPLYMKGRVENTEPKKVEYEWSGASMMSLKEVLEKTEKEMIVKTLNRTGGHLTQTAEILGIPRQTLKYKMDKLDINKKIYKK